MVRPAAKKARRLCLTFPTTNAVTHVAYIERVNTCLHSPVHIRVSEMKLFQPSGKVEGLEKHSGYPNQAIREAFHCTFCDSKLDSYLHQ